jgi:hypothetical protein
MLENIKNISEGQTLYLIDKDFFGKVHDMCLGHFWLLEFDAEHRPYGYFCSDDSNTVIVKNDTPENRLVIRLKYS